MPPPMKPRPVGSWPPPMTVPERTAAARSDLLPRNPSGPVKGGPHERIPAPLSTPEGPGSVSGAPNSPPGSPTPSSAATSISRSCACTRSSAARGRRCCWCTAGPDLVRLAHAHAALTEDFQVIAVDQRGIGLSDKPQDGYDTATLASDLVALMAALGHRRFAMYGTDTGMPIAYAWPPTTPSDSSAWSSPKPPPGHLALTAPAPAPAAQRPALAPRLQPAPRRGERTTRQGPGGRLLRRGVRRLGRDQQAPRRRRQLLHRHARRRPRRPARELRDLPGVPHHHRAGRAAQDPAAAQPVLAIGGEESSGAMVGDTMRLVADDVQTLVIPGCGHWVAEQAPRSYWRH